MSTAATEPLSPEQSSALAEFARACKTAARSVSLYPATHPAIRASLSRVTTAASRLIPVNDVTLTVHPDAIAIDGRTATRPDPSIGELAELLHDRLVGLLRIERGADAEDWHTLLLLLGRAPADLIIEGGILKAWTASGRAHFEIREIDYAEVLRERAGGQGAEWDRIIAYCLQGGDASTLDERALASLLETLGDGSKFGALLDRLQTAETGAGGASVGARAAALLQLLRKMRDAATERQGEEGAALVLQTAADGASRLTPEMMLALVGQSLAGSGEDAKVASGVLDRMNDPTVASFVAGSIVSERGATDRLAQAFEALVPEIERKERLLDLAKDEVGRSPLGQEEGFESLWESAASMLKSYSDKSYVSDAYARELSGARAQALDIERVSDDPPERIEAWLSTVSNDSVRQLDLSLLLDLLRIETDPPRWRDVASVAAPEIERRLVLGDIAGSQQLIDALVRELAPEGREALRSVAEPVVDALASGPLIRHIVLHLRKVENAEVEPLNRLAHTLGPRVIRPLAEALASEENSKAIGRLRELLLGFGAAGRQSVEQLKNSSNPAVRRTAIDLLRVFGGHEALPELASMLDDADPQVQRESIRAIVQIGTEASYAVLEQALVGGASRDTILQQLIGLRDDKAIPLLCYVLNHSAPRGKLVEVHAQIIEALGGLAPHRQSTRTLRTVLYRGEWWAPFRTAALRQAAAAALRRIGSAETMAVLEEAAKTGARGVRNVARAYVGTMPRRERQRA
jgi:hypothetical protein